MRTLVAALVTAAAMLAIVEPADAATVEFSEDQYSLFGIRYLAGSGEVNTVVLDYEMRHTADNPNGTNSVTLRDPGAVIAVEGSRCEQIDQHTVTCGYSGNLADARITLGDNDDSVSVEPERPPHYPSLVANGGPGNDTLIGTPHEDRLNGGGGIDTLRGRSGYDTLSDGDTDATADADVLDGGGDDNDEVTYETRTERIDLRLDDDGDGTVVGEGDQVTDVEAITGGSGDDILDGSHADDTLVGGPGADVLHGSDGEDRLQGGVGHDTLRGRADDDYLVPGGGRDRLSCGEGRDDEVASPERGELLRACERVHFRFDADDGGVRFALKPKAVGPRTIRYGIGCPKISEFDGEEIGCRAPLTLRDGGGLLGRGLLKGVTERRTDHTDVKLTARGERLAHRKRGVRATGELKFRGRRALRWTFTLRL